MHGMINWRRAHVLHSIHKASIFLCVAIPSARRSDDLLKMNERDGMGVANEERTAVLIAVAGVERNLFEECLRLSFLLGTRQEHLHKMCGRFPTSAHAFSCCWSLMWSRLASVARKKFDPSQARH